MVKASMIHHMNVIIDDVERARDFLARSGFEVRPLRQMSGDSEFNEYRALRSRGNTIQGGTSEVMRNILAERVLGLPKD